MAVEEVGIRELRQNLSVYVARVKKGERFVVTEHNRPVAELVPTRKPDELTAEETWEELVERVGIKESPLPPGFVEPLQYPADWEGPLLSEEIIRRRRRERY